MSPLVGEGQGDAQETALEKDAPPAQAQSLRTAHPQLDGRVRTPRVGIDALHCMTSGVSAT